MKMLLHLGATIPYPNITATSKQRNQTLTPKIERMWSIYNTLAPYFAHALPQRDKSSFQPCLSAYTAAFFPPWLYGRGLPITGHSGARVLSPSFMFGFSTASARAELIFSVSMDHGYFMTWNFRTVSFNVSNTEATSQ
jgi:hypothetical protein